MIKLNGKIVKFDKFPNGEEVKLCLSDLEEFEKFPNNVSLNHIIIVMMK